MRPVVAEQEYDPAVGTPATKIPAFAAVFSLKNRDKFYRKVKSLEDETDVMQHEITTFTVTLPVVSLA